MKPVSKEKVDLISDGLNKYLESESFKAMKEETPGLARVIENVAKSAYQALTDEGMTHEELVRLVKDPVLAAEHNKNWKPNAEYQSGVPNFNYYMNTKAATLHYAGKGVSIGLPYDYVDDKNYENVRKILESICSINIMGVPIDIVEI